MKRTFNVICAAALVMSVACQKEETSVSKMALTATLEQQVDKGATKTALGPDNTVLWSAGDRIIVNTSEGMETLPLVDGQGTAIGRFGSTTGDNPDYAIYPASVKPGLDGSTFTFTLPATQTYSENGFADGANVAVAKVSGGNMAFKNVCGVLKFQLKGSMKVSRIELTGKSGEKLNGTFTVDVNANPFVGAVKTDGDPADAEKTITLDCSHFGETSEGKGNGGVVLSYGAGSTFCIVVPISAFAAGFDAVVYDAAGEAFFTVLETEKANTIVRSTITRMPEKKVSVTSLTVPEGYTALEYIESTGSQYINTGIAPSRDVSYSIVFTSNHGSSIETLMGSNMANGGADRLYHSPSSKTIKYQGCNPELVSSVIISGNTYSLRKEPDRVFLDDVSYNYSYAAGGAKPICVLANLKNDDSPEYLANVKLRCASIYTSDNMLMYLLPVIRKADNVAGMWDVVGEKFYESDGTNAFVAGPELHILPGSSFSSDSFETPSEDHGGAEIQW